MGQVINLSGSASNRILKLARTVQIWLGVNKLKLDSGIQETEFTI